MYTANNVKTAIQVPKTDRQMVQLTRCTCLWPCKVRTGLSLLVEWPCNTNEINLGSSEGVPLHSS